VHDLVALIKADAGKYSFASPGFGTPSHLLGEQFRITAGLDLVHVPYGGSGPAITSVVAGHTPIGFAALSPAVAQIEDGMLRALAIMGKERLKAMPNLPTIAEAGYPGLDGDGWVGALVPVGTPKEIIALLRREIVEIIALPGIKQRLSVLGFEAVGSTPQEFTAQFQLELEKWAKVIRAANLKAESKALSR
jgi:tripartite-type tricarboxylate transporter receptor subunit TctC